MSYQLKPMNNPRWNLEPPPPNHRPYSPKRYHLSSTTAEIQQVRGGAVASGKPEGRGEPSFESHSSSGSYPTGDELNRYSHDSSAPNHHRRWNNNHNNNYSNNNHHHYGNRPGRSSPKGFVPVEQNRHNVEFQVRGILNKITPEKFDKLSTELLDIGLQSTDILKRVLLLIFNKALDDQKYSFMYARLCKLICESLNNYGSEENNKEIVFKKLLLSKCKEEFENRRIAFEEFENKREPLDDDEEEQRAIAKQKMLGNIRFICELGKQDLLPKNILHDCIRQLLSKKKTQSYKDKVKDLECLCEIMKNIGYLLEAEVEARPLLEQYFERMKSFSVNPEFPSRIKFMLLDVIDLRKDKWVPRQREVKPSILERNEELDYTDPVISNYLRNFKNNKNKQNEDVFSRNNLGPYYLGTGPGAITDDFTPLQSYNPKNSQGAYGNPTGGQGTGGMGGRYGKNSPPNFQGGGSGGTGGGYNQRQRDYRNQNNQLFPANNQGYAPGNGNTRETLPPRFQNRMNPNNYNNNNNNNNGQYNNGKGPSRHNNFQPFFLSGNDGTRGPSANKDMVYNESPRMSPKLTPRYPLQPGRSPQKINGKDNTLNEIANLKIAEPAPETTKKINIYNECEKLLIKYYEDENVEEFVNSLKELNFNFEDALFDLLRISLARKEEERAKTFLLITMIKRDFNLVNSAHFQTCLKSIFKKVGDLNCEFPRARSQFASFVGTLIVEKVCTLKEIAELFEGGKHYPSFPLLLQSLKTTQGEDWLFEEFTASKINLMNMLPEGDRNKNRMADVLEERKLTFLYPMLRIESEITKQVTAPDCNSETLYKWLRENVNVSLQSSTEFISVVFTALMKHIIGSNRTEDGTFTVANYKQQLSELSKFRDVLRKFLDQKPALQLVVLYCLQAYCDELNFPKGLLEKWFNMLYESDIVDPVVFTTWKEDINDQYPGKGKALFQVNNWLVWLEDEEEDEEDEEEDED